MTKDEDKDKDKKYVIWWRTYYLQSAPHSKIVDLDLPKDILDCDRVAEVGKLLASAKNAFNSFVGRVFANSRQKTFFFAYYQNCNKLVVLT